MAGKKRIGGVSRRRIKQLALKLVLNNLDKYISETFDNEGILLNYDIDVRDKIRKEILLIRSRLYQKLIKATLPNNLWRKIFKAKSSSRQKVYVQPFGDRIEVLKKIVNGGNQGS